MIRETLHLSGHSSKNYTLLKSFLSVWWAKTSPIRKIPNMRQTLERTTKFPVSSSLLNSVKTLLKSMGFGATKMLPPNAERCVHKQCNFPRIVFHPTFRTKIQLSKLYCAFWNDGTRGSIYMNIQGRILFTLYQAQHSFILKFHLKMRHSLE